MNKLIFLSGTCGNNNWREPFIADMVARGVPAETFFNPVTPDWNEEAQAREDVAKRDCTFMLYYLGDPQQPDNRCSFYSLAEACIALHEAPARTLVVFDSTGMPAHAVKASEKTCKDLKDRFPYRVFDTLEEAKEWIAENV